MSNITDDDLGELIGYPDDPRINDLPTEVSDEPEPEDPF